MVELKKDALKDVTTLSKTAPETLVKTKEVLNQAVADLYVAHIALHQVCYGLIQDFFRFY